jgi:hypothetical protein
VLPLDVYLENENELSMSTVTGEIADELKGTLGEKLLRGDPEARVVVNFHGVSTLLFCQSHDPFAFCLLFFLFTSFSTTTTMCSDMEALSNSLKAILLSV